MPAKDLCDFFEPLPMFASIYDLLLFFFLYNSSLALAEMFLMTKRLSKMGSGRSVGAVGGWVGFVCGWLSLACLGGGEFGGLLHCNFWKCDAAPVYIQHIF